MTRSAFAKVDSFSRLARDRSGAAAVEFAIVAPVLLTLIVGILMLGVAYYEGATVQWSLERSLRAAMIDPEVSAGDIEAAIAEDIGEAMAANLDFNYDVDESGVVPLAVVTVGYDVPLIIPFLPEMSLRFSAENVAPIPEA